MQIRNFYSNAPAYADATAEAQNWINTFPPVVQAKAQISTAAVGIGGALFIVTAAVPVAPR